MDAVELSCPVDVVVPAKLMGSDGCGGVRVSTNKAETGCETARNIGVNSSIQRCSASISKKDARSRSSASDSSLWHKLFHSHDFLHERLTKLCLENSSESPSSVGQSGLLPNPSLESRESIRKAGKVSRNSGGASKKPKVALVEDAISSPRGFDIKDTKEQGSTHLDKPQTVKQRNNCTGKRGDKRNSKAPAKTFSNINSAFGENAFFDIVLRKLFTRESITSDKFYQLTNSLYRYLKANVGVVIAPGASTISLNCNILDTARSCAYGLKPEIKDVTNSIEDLSLNELLEGSYECPLGKDKPKKVEDANDTFLTLVRNVWSVLPAPRPIQSQSSAESDGGIDKTLGSPSSISVLVIGENSEKENAPEADSSPSSKDHSTRPEIPSTPLDFPTCGPIDVLRHLGLPPPKDLDSLLQDASKPSQYFKNNSDPRSGKQPLSRVGLPHFPWSHAFNGNCRTNSEAAKLLTSRTLCQGRWLRIGNMKISPWSVSNTFTDLDSLAFNQSLVPSRQKQTVAGSDTSRCQCASASVDTLDKATCVSSGQTIQPKGQEDALHCPRLLAAARTLYDIALQSKNDNLNGILRFPNKVPQKSIMRAQKSKTTERPQETHATTTTVSLGTNSSDKHAIKDTAEQSRPSKRPRLLTTDNSRGSPSSSATAMRKHSCASKIKQQSCLIPLPPPRRTPEKPPTCQQKARRFMYTD